MRIALLALAVFCAVISGWTASLAQIQGITRAPPAHHATALVQDTIAAAQHHPCPATARTCDDHPRAVHPMLCAACFAVMAAEIDTTRDALPVDVIRPSSQRPMRATAIKPRFPPPKSSGL